MKRLYKDRFDKKFSGVCGGIAQYVKIDSSIIRLLFVIFSVLSGGLLVIAYVLLWWLLPLGPRSYIEANYKRLYKSRKDRKIAGVCGGLGAYLRIDSNIIRILALVSTFFTAGVSAIIYIVAAGIIPEHPCGK